MHQIIFPLSSSVKILNPTLPPTIYRIYCDWNRMGGEQGGDIRHISSQSKAGYIRISANLHSGREGGGGGSSIPKYFCKLYVTWVNLPYLEVWKSGHRTAKLGSLNQTFFRGIKLPTLAVSRPRSQTADLGSLMAGFQYFSAFGPQTANLGSFTAAFQSIAQSMMGGMFSNCHPRQFHGRFSALWSQAADLGFYGQFLSTLVALALKLPTLAVSWPVSSTCWPWKFHGCFSAPIKSGKENANLCSFS